MKKTVLLICLFLSYGIKAQNIVGAWESFSTSKNGDKLKTVVIFSKDYQVSTTYNEATGEFIHTNGGSWTLKGDIMTEKIEFHTANNELVGNEISFKVIIIDNSIEIVDNDIKLNRIE